MAPNAVHLHQVMWIAAGKYLSKQPDISQMFPWIKLSCETKFVQLTESRIVTASLWIGVPLLSFALFFHSVGLICLCQAGCLHTWSEIHSESSRDSLFILSSLQVYLAPLVPGPYSWKCTRTGYLNCLDKDPVCQRCQEQSMSLAVKRPFRDCLRPATTLCAHLDFYWQLCSKCYLDKIESLFCHCCKPVLWPH